MSELLVRPYRPEDLDALKKIHADSKMPYKFPDLESPLFVVKLVVERAGKPAMLAAGRLGLETYLMSSGSARERLEDMVATQDEYLTQAWAMGIDDCYAAVPKRIERHFGKHMESLGWERGRTEFHNWYRDTARRVTI